VSFGAREVLLRWIPEKRHKGGEPTFVCRTLGSAQQLRKGKRTRKEGAYCTPLATVAGRPKSSRRKRKPVMPWFVIFAIR
jgi:hypothetical protein